ncbi:MAG: SWIM zinc finger family protein [Erysipelotrichaceae bacterium]
MGLKHVNRRIIQRGHEYYLQHRVMSWKQMGEYIYYAQVRGSHKSVYQVALNVQDLKSSNCDCPYAKGHDVCKHMVAAYFSIIGEENEEENYLFYEEDYFDEYGECGYYDEEEYDEYGYYDEYDNGSYRFSGFVKPIYFEDALDNFINKLDQKQLKELLYKELIKNEEATYHTYLEKEYEEYTLKKGIIYQLIEKLNIKFIKLINDSESPFSDYNEDLLTDEEMYVIKQNYQEAKTWIDGVLLNIELTQYRGYQQIALFYKSMKDEVLIKNQAKTVIEYLEYLKQSHIRNRTRKANVLISIYILSDLSIEELTDSLIKNIKYTEYLQYVVEHYERYMELSKQILCKICNQGNYDKSKITRLIKLFYEKAEAEGEATDELLHELIFYQFIFDKDVEALNKLCKYPNFNNDVQRIIKRTKNEAVLRMLYLHLHCFEDLFQLHFNQQNDRMLIQDLSYYKDQYNDTLYVYFKDKFYSILKKGKDRKNYRQASFYVKAIRQLNNGEDLVKDLISKLKHGEYAKCITLFKEIDNAI